MKPCVNTPAKFAVEVPKLVIKTKVCNYHAILLWKTLKIDEE